MTGLADVDVDGRLPRCGLVTLRGVLMHINEMGAITLRQFVVVFVLNKKPITI